MELFGKIVMVVVISIIIAFFSAACYSLAWNMVVPTLFGLSPITMLQAYVATFAIGVVTLNHVSKEKDFESAYISGIALSITKAAMSVLVAFIVKVVFL